MSFLVAGSLAGPFGSTTQAQDLSAHDMLMIGESGDADPWVQHPGIVADADDYDISDDIVTGSIGAPPRDLPGPLSLMRSSRDSSQIRGLSFAPNDTVSFEATGSMESGSGGVGGEFSLRFSF